MEMKKEYKSLKIKHLSFGMCVPDLKNYRDNLFFVALWDKIIFIYLLIFISCRIGG